LQLGDTAAQRAADAVERGVDDGDVELNHAVAEAHGGERQRRGQPRTDRFGLWNRHGERIRRRKLWGCRSHGSPAVSKDQDTSNQARADVLVASDISLDIEV
jgi:hypothetical protein